MTLHVASLHRYPVKGLSPERLDRVALTKGDYFPGDRLFAIENGPSGFDPAAPKHQPKIKFLMLMRDEALARLRTRYDEASRILLIQDGGREVVRADPSTEAGRHAIGAFFQAFMTNGLRGAPKVLTAPDGHRFTDSRRGFVSIVNLASVQALETMVGAPVDPLRFRANVYVSGLPAWAEFGLVGQVLTTDSGVRLNVTTRTERCAAVNVDPETGLRDLDLPNAMQRRLGHADCGVYAEVLQGGVIQDGTRLTVQDAAEVAEAEA